MFQSTKYQNNIKSFGITLMGTFFRKNVWKTISSRYKFKKEQNKVKIMGLPSLKSMLLFQLLFIYWSFLYTLISILVTIYEINIKQILKVKIKRTLWTTCYLVEEFAFERLNQLGYILWWWMAQLDLDW